MMKIFVVVVLALMLPGLLGYALAAPVITTSPVAFVTDGADGFEELEGPKGITAVTIGSSTYALVASYSDNGVQIMDITDPFNPVPIAAVTDGVNGFEELEGARDITAVTIGSSVYAIVTASNDHGMQIINITAPSNPVPTSHISSIPGTYFTDPREVTTVTIGSSTYALVAASGSGVHIIDITDPSSPVSVAYASDTNAGFDALGNSRGITTTTIGSSTYAIVAAFEGAVQIMNITDPSAPTPVGSVHDSQDTMLRGAIAVTTFTSGSSMYALVAAQTDDAVQILNITDPSNPVPVAFVEHGVAGFDTLRYPETITTVTFGSSTYALVAAFLDGIQIIDVTNPSSPTPAASVDRFDARFDGFPLPEDMVVTEVGSRTYALVASNMGNGIQIIDVDLTSGPVLTSAALSEETGILEITFMDTVDTTPASTVDLSGLTVHDSGQSVSLAGATLRTEADSAVISIELTEIQSRSVAAMASPRLDISSSAVADTLGNPIELSLGSIITVSDDVAPEIVSVIMNTVTGILEITFSDRIDATPASMVYTNGMTIRDSGQSVSLAGATLRTEADSAVISIELTEDQRQSIVAPVSPLLDVSRYDIFDTDGNPIESSSGNAITVKNTNEAELPAFRSANYTAGDGQLAITFSRSLNGTVHLDRLHVRDAGQSSGGVTMTGAVGRSVSGDTLTITLAASQVATIGSLTTPQLDVDQRAVFDLAGIGIADTPDQPVILINTPPTVDAGQDQIINEDTQVTLSGTATDADGDPLTYLWSHDQATGIIINNSTSLLSTFTTPQVNSNTTFTFTLTAGDGNATGSDTVSVTVLDVPIDDRPVILINTPPTVDAGQDQIINEDTQVTLSGTATDADGDPLTYLWSHDQATGIIINNSTSLLSTFTTPQVNSNTTFTFTLTAGDGNATGSDTVSVTVLDVPIDDRPVILINTPPTVDAGQDQTINEDTQVTLSGTATDADGDPLTYLWSHDQATGIIINNSTSLLSTFTTPQVNSNTTFTFTLTAGDGNATGSDTVSVTVLDVPIDDRPVILINTPPTVDAGQDQIINEDTQVTLSGTATDADGDPLTYLWSHDQATGIIINNSTSLLSTFTAPQVNSNTTFTFTLTAGDGNATGSDTVSVTVLDVPIDDRPVILINTPPTVDAGQDQTINEDTQVTLSGTATDADGDPLTYLWSHDQATGIIINNSTSLLSTFTAPQVNSNTTFTFTLTAGDGNATGSDTVSVTVLDVPIDDRPVILINTPPTVDAGQDQIINEDTQVTLSGTATDADGDPLTYLWSHDQATGIIINNSTSLLSTFTAPQVISNTTFTFTLTAGDGNATGSDTVSVTVLDVPVDDQLNSTNTPGSNTVVLEPNEAHGPRDIGQVTLSGVTPGVIDASWEAPSEAPADYRIRWTKTDESYKTWTDLSGNAFPTATSQTIAGLEEGETYKVTVRARYGGTSGDWSGNVIITVAETAITVANTQATGSPIINGTVQVRQTLTADTSSIADADGMTNATLSYQWVSSDGVTYTDIPEATTSRYVLTAGDQGRVIQVRVTFTDDTGHAESLTSNATVAVTSAFTIPSVPTGLSVLPGDGGSLNVSWQTPISDGGSVITGYTIQWKASSGSWTVPADVSEATATGTTYTITGLTDGTSYTVRIIAANHVGNGEPTLESTAIPITPQQLGPRDIGRMTLSSTIPGVIDASWDAPAEAPAAYRISWAKVGESYKTWTDLSGNAFPTATSQTITGLEEGGVYKIKMRATYAGTSGDWSSDVTVTVAGS